MTILKASDIVSAVEALPRPGWAAERNVSASTGGEYVLADTSEQIELGQFKARVECYSTLNVTAREGLTGVLEANIEWSDPAYENSHEQIILPIDRIPDLARLLDALTAKVA